MLLRSLLLVVAFCTSISVQALPETPEEFVKTFQSGGPAEQEKAAQILAWAGLSSPQIFDLVEANVLKSLPLAKDRVTINYVAHLTKALAYSGNEKYRPTIEKVINEAPHKKLKKHAIQALPMLPIYAKWNPIIVPKPWPDNSYPEVNERLANMLKSDDAELVRIAAKRIHHEHNYQPELLALLNTSIEQNYQKNLDRDHLDAIAWVCRALAGSRAAEYKATIEKVASGATEKKLRGYAKKYLSYYSN
jgi:hypothetical protein